MGSRRCRFSDVMQPGSLSRDEFAALAERYPVVPVAAGGARGSGDCSVGVREAHRRTATASCSNRSKEASAGPGGRSSVGIRPSHSLLATASARCDGLAVDVPSGDPLTVFESLLDRFNGPESGHRGRSRPRRPAAARRRRRIPRLRHGALHRATPESPARRSRTCRRWCGTSPGRMAAIDRFRDTVVLIENVFIGSDPEAQYEAAVEALRVCCGPARRRRLVSRDGASRFRRDPHRRLQYRPFLVRSGGGTGDRSHRRRRRFPDRSVATAGGRVRWKRVRGVPGRCAW